MRNELNVPVKYKDQLHGYYSDWDVSNFRRRLMSWRVYYSRGLLWNLSVKHHLPRVAISVRQAYPRHGGQFKFAWSDLDQALSRKTIMQLHNDIFLL